jgi:CheY-like chemotaxis protein
MNTDKKRILVAEDNPGLARVLAFNLQHAGFEVTVCQDGAQAWGTLRQAEFDAVVTDYEMPEMNGEQLCRRMRDLGQYAETPIVMVTARETELDVRRLEAELALAAVYPKPYSPRELVQIVQQLMDSVPARQVGS